MKKNEKNVGKPNIISRYPVGVYVNDKLSVVYVVWCVTYGFKRNNKFSGTTEYMRQRISLLDTHIRDNYPQLFLAAESARPGINVIEAAADELFTKGI